MHALSMLHKLFESCDIVMHTKRRDALFKAVAAALAGHTLTLTRLAVGMTGETAVKHRVKCMDRLLGNVHLHAECYAIYAALSTHSLDGVERPLIVIDWSDLSTARGWQLLRASLAIEGRCITLYEQTYPLTRLGSPKVHKAFLKRLRVMLPPGTRPIVLTDAGFRSTWFKLIDAMGWDWIGRIRNCDMVARADSESWIGAKSLYAEATGVACDLGAWRYVRNHPLACRLVLIKRVPKQRHAKSRAGKKVRSSHSRKQACAQREPWLLATSVGLAHLQAAAIVALYAQRMQIEESFRDTKSARFGLGFEWNRSRTGKRLSVLLLIAALALYVLWLVGTAAKARQLHLHFESVHRTSRPVLSVITLARLAIQCASPPRFTMSQLRAASLSIQQRLRHPQYAEI